MDRHTAQGEPQEKLALQGATAFLLSILGDLRTQSNATKAGSLDRNETSSGETSNADTRRTDTREVGNLGQVVNRMDERAFGLLLLLLALPCCLPFIYILPQIVAVPMIALASQLMMGRHQPWFPQRLALREFVIDDFEGVITRAQKYVGWFERLAHPRLTFLTEGVGVRIVGALLAIPCASILVPLPSTNTIPGIGVAIASVGLIERDGLMVILGLIIGLIWVGLLLFLGVEGLQLLKAWILGQGE